MNYKRIIKNMSKAWVSDANIARILWVSTTVVRYLLMRWGYTPSTRTQEKLKSALNDFLDFLKS